MSIGEKRRELFEAYWTGKGLVLIDENTGRYLISTQGGWMAFNSALDAVTITLPDTYQVGAIKCDAHQGTLIACRAAIESTGLGLKVLP